MKKLLLVLFLISSITFAQTAGEAGFSFLKIGFGARNIAMGDLGVVGSNDVSSINYNPALITLNDDSQIMLGNNSWIQGLNSKILGASFGLFGLPFAVTLNTTSIDDIEIRSISGELESTFNAYYFYTGLSTGFNLYGDLSAGITVKYLYEGLLSDEATGLGYDLGLHYPNVFRNFDVGFSVRNLGSVNKLRNEETKLPVDIRLGGAYHYQLESINSELTAITGFQKYSAADDSHIHLGAEFIYNGLIALRAGYVSGYVAKDISAGLGINWNNINFDYAFTNFTYNLGSAHTISLMYTFN